MARWWELFRYRAHSDRSKWLWNLKNLLTGNRTLCGPGTLTLQGPVGPSTAEGGLGYVGALGYAAPLRLWRRVRSGAGQPDPGYALAPPALHVPH